MTGGDLVVFLLLFGFAVFALPLIFVVIDDEVEKRKWEKERGK